MYLTCIINIFNTTTLVSIRPLIKHVIQNTINKLFSATNHHQTTIFACKISVNHIAMFTIHEAKFDQVGGFGEVIINHG